MQIGVQRDRAGRAIPPSRPRRPNTPSILRQLKYVWLPTSDPSDPSDNIMLWAASVLCFFGFFRSGELTLPSASAFNPTVHLAWGDVVVNSTHMPSLVQVHLKRSKCDQLGNGVNVFVGRTGDTLCPVTAVMAYVATRGPHPGPFFQFTDQTPLTKPRFVARVCQALSRAGITDTDYCGHSFRIGVAAAAARAGIEDSTSQALGRWNRQAFLRYIRMDRDDLARFSCHWPRLAADCRPEGALTIFSDLRLYLGVGTCYLVLRILFSLCVLLISYL